MNIQVNEEFLNAVLDYVGQSSEIIQKQAEVEGQVEKVAPGVIDTLIKAGMLNENQRAEALEAAKDPVKVLDSLAKTAAVAAEKKAEEVPALGGSPKVKEAAAKAPAAFSKQSESMATADRDFLSRFGF